MSRFIKLNVAGEQLPPEAAEYSAVLDKLLNVEWHPKPIRCDSWQAAMDAAAALGDDWRAPNIDELCTLPDRSRAKPAIDTTFFPDTPFDDWYWSSSAVVGWPECAWNVYFDDGSVGYDRRSFSGFVRPVRVARARQ